MAQLNFNLLNPPGSENIANAFARGVDQSRAERRDEQALRMQEAQMQQSLRQGRMQELQLAKAQRDEEALNKFYGSIAANGGPKDPIEIEEKMIGSGIPQVVQTGISSRMKRLEVEAARKRAKELMLGSEEAPTAAPQASPAAAPVAAPGDLLGLGNQLMPTNALSASAPTAPVANALVAPSTPAASQDADRLAQIRRAQLQIALGDEGVRKAGEIALKALMEPQRMYVVDGNLVDANGKPAFTATPKPPAPPPSVAEYKFAQTPEGGNFKGTYQEFVTSRARASASQTVVKLPPQEAEFEKQIGAAQAKGVADSMTAAQDAAKIIDTVNLGRSIMDSGMITGAGSQFFVSLNQALKTAGLDFGYGTASANSQAYAATMAANVGRLIKQFGAGTGLSNADREYAEKMAAGNISLDAMALRKILDINERASRGVIDAHNKKVSGVQSVLPLKVEQPPTYQSSKSSRSASTEKPAAPAASTGGTWQVVR